MAAREEVPMTQVEVLEDVVRGWAVQAAPGDRRIADNAAALARIAYAESATVIEACHVARAYVQSAAQHPARGRAARHGAA